MKTKRKRTITEAEKLAIIEQLKWSGPAGLQQWAAVYDVHPNTMRKWLKKQVVQNEAMSPRLWRIAIEELPSELVLNVLFPLEINQSIVPKTH